MNENVEFLANFSIAYKAGVEAKKLGIPLKETAIRNLRHGTPQYDDFLAGYDSFKVEVHN
jgi:hypothetical protein